MSIHRLIAFAAFAAAALPTRAAACEYDPFLFQLPGETAQTAEARSDRILSDYAIIHRASRQAYAYQKAKAIYLGRKLSTTRDPNSHAEVTTVRPIGAIRGPLPKGLQKLRDDAASGMCDTVGDGDVSDLAAGTYVVVFEGLPEDSYRRRGKDSFDVSAIRNTDLLDAVRKFGKDLE